MLIIAKGVAMENCNRCPFLTCYFTHKPFDYQLTTKQNNVEALNFNKIAVAKFPKQIFFVGIIYLKLQTVCFEAYDFLANFWVIILMRLVFGFACNCKIEILKLYINQHASLDTSKKSIVRNFIHHLTFCLSAY